MKGNEKDKMKREDPGKQRAKRPAGMSGPSRRFFLSGMLIVLLTLCATVDAGRRSHAGMLQGQRTVGVDRRHAIEISVSRKVLILYEKTAGNKLLPRREYKVGTAVLGLDVYPLGKGQVTAIDFYPSWYPTPYSREVFRKRGIELPPAVPPGHPLNYMGAAKISLSHRTRKGAIYRIHGNNNPGRVGRRVTGGCFVMYNDDVLELARTISVGTEVNILP